MPKGSVPRNKNTLRAKTVAGGAQQYVRGKTAMDRVIAASDAVMSTRNSKAKQMLLRAQKAEMTPQARAYSAQKAEERKRVDLRFGRQRAEAQKKLAVRLERERAAKQKKK